MSRPIRAEYAGAIHHGIPEESSPCVRLAALPQLLNVEMRAPRLRSLHGKVSKAITRMAGRLRTDKTLARIGGQVEGVVTNVGM